MLNLTLLALTCVLNVFLGLLVLLRNTRATYSRLFFAMTLATVMWAVTNYLTNLNFAHTVSYNTIFNKMAYLSAVVAIFSGMMFSYYFPSKRKFLSREKLLLSLSVLTLICLSMTSLVAGTVVHGRNGLAFTPGRLIGLYAGGLFLYLIIISRNLWQSFKHTSGSYKEQVRLILFGFGFTVVCGIISNILVPVMVSDWSSTQYGPLLTIVLVASIAYAIVRHKLFDIRAVLARSVGYLMIVVTITAVYGIALFGAIDIIFRGPQNEVWRQVASIILITPLALMFQRTKLFFDRVTNRLFYRDAYDTQDVLDQIGRVVVSEIDLYRMLRTTRAILTEALKVTFVEYALIKNDTVYFEARTNKIVEPPALFDLGEVIREQKKPIIIVDEPRGATRLHQKFVEANVAISLRLKTQDQVVGYILLGKKRSGDIFSTQDKKLLEIMASQLAISMQNALRFEEIQNFNLTLQARVSEATHKLRNANEKLKVLDETKDDFISMASHQLRTPLTSIKGYISMVLEGDAGKLTKQQEQMLGQAFFSSQRMVFLIADLLNLSRLKTGKFIIEPSPVNLADVVEQELQQLKEAAANRGHVLEFVKPEAFPTLMLDETKMRQVIMNFTDNAIYYTPNGGHIIVRLVDNPQTVELRIEDNGIGVPKHEQPHLFTKFFRAGNARKARPDGTGLGLFMAKKVIVASGGSLIFTTEEGKGSTFGFSFAKSRVAAPEVAPAASVPVSR